MTDDTPTPTDYPVDRNPIRIESDDEGIVIVIDIGEMATIEGRELFTPYAWPTKVGGKLTTDAALELYEHIERTLGEWALEGLAARRAVAAGVSLEEFIGEDEDDEDEEDWWESLSSASDLERKRRRENG